MIHRYTKVMHNTLNEIPTTKYFIASVKLSLLSIKYQCA